MTKEFKDWLDEFVDNGANPKDVTNWPEEAGGTIELQDKTVSPTTIRQEIVADENYDGLGKVTINAIELQNKEISPSTSSQSVIPDKGYDGLREVTVNAIALQDKTVTPDAVRQEITYDSNYNGLGKVIVEAVEPVELQDKTVTPTTEIQRVTADADYSGLGTVTVNAVTSAIDSNIKAENIKKDVAILGVTGEYEAPEVPDYTGSYTITENGTIAISGKKATEDITVEVPSVQPVLVEANVTSFYGGSDIIRPEQGVDGFSQINITGIYDSNLQPYNIKKGITILGCPGNYDPNSDYIDYKTFFNSFQNKYLDGEKLVQFMHKYNLDLEYSESGSIQQWAVNFLTYDNGLQDSVLFGYDFYNSSCDHFELEGGGSIYSSEVESEEDFISKVNELSSVSLSSPDSNMKSPYKFKVVIVKEYDSTLEVPLSEIVALFVDSHH